MSTRDIEITSVPDGSDLDSVPGEGPGTALSTYVIPRGVPKASPLAPKEKDPLVRSVLRKRWWLLMICGAVSGVVAFFVAYRYQTDAAEIVGKLLYDGLPELTKTKAYSPQSVETHAELLESPLYLNTVIEKRAMGSQLDVMGLTNALKVEPDPRSKTITLTLTWSDVAEGTAIVNDLMEMYIERVVQDRRRMATEHVKHCEQELFRAEAVEADCQKRLRNYHEKLGLSEVEHDQIPESLRQYAMALNTAEVMVTSLSSRVKELEAGRAEMIDEFNKKVLEAKIGKIRASAQKYETTSEPYAQHQRLIAELRALGKSASKFEESTKWKEAVDAVGKTSHPWANQYTSPELVEAGTQIDKVTADLETTKLNLKATMAETKDLTAKIGETKKRLESANNALRPQTEERRTLDDELAVAMTFKHEVKAQLQALQQIAGTPVKEFSVAAPAAFNGKATSTFKKLFAGAFVLMSLVLAAPVFGCEYYLNRDSPADETARRFGLPLLSRGTFTSRLARGKGGELTLTKTADGDGEDSLRLLALRIQQALRRPGAVIVFTALEHEESPISLICKLAICFAEREELVLIIDADGTLDESRKTLAALFQGTPHRTPEGTPLDPTLTNGQSSESNMATFGVADFLCHEELELGDLVIPTKFPRVDCIHGGVSAFPREGLASRRMSELLEQSRGRYSMILVASPSTKNQTDVQLLAARADGMLFTVAPNTPITTRGHEVLQDLIDLEAPVMGLIG